MISRWLLPAAVVWIAVAGPALGESSSRAGRVDSDGEQNEIDTDHLFGFTKGTDVDEPGAKGLVLELDGRFGKQTGSYTGLSQRLEYSFTPWRDFDVGLGAAFAAHDISGVEGLDNRRQLAFESLSVELKRRFLDRDKAPFGLSLIAEPQWTRVDDVSGERVDKFGIEFTLAADKELIKDRFYGAFNLVYEPGWVRFKNTGKTERESTVGLAVAGMTRVLPSVFAGGEVRYLRNYEGAVLNTFAGEALFVGPVLFVTVNDKLTLVAAYSAQVAGRAAGASGALDLENFERHRAKLKAVVGF
jgi:hypothetical protein